jgi:transcriptional regulator with PAS, ATPase and Fis domain
MQEHHWNRTRVAKVLGVSRPTLLDWLKRAGLQ